MRPEGEGVDHLVLLDGAGRLHVLDAVGVDAAARAHQEDARRFGLPVGGGGRLRGGGWRPYRCGGGWDLHGVGDKGRGWCLCSVCGVRMRWAGDV